VRISNNLCRCIEDGLENVALADREIEVDGIAMDMLLATRRIGRAAMADGTMTRREWQRIEDRMSMLESALVQTLALDVEDLELSKRLAGRLDGMSRKGHGSAANAPAECGLSR